MEHRVRAAEARVHFGAIMRRVVEQGERILVERGGRPYVVLLSYDDYQRLQAIGQPQDWKVVLMEGIQLAREMWRVQEGETLPPAEDVIRELREERLVQLTGLC